MTRRCYQFSICCLSPVPIVCSCIGVFGDQTLLEAGLCPSYTSTQATRSEAASAANGSVIGMGKDGELGGVEGSQAPVLTRGCRCCIPETRIAGCVVPGNSRTSPRRFFRFLCDWPHTRTNRPRRVRRAVKKPARELLLK